MTSPGRSCRASMRCLYNPTRPTTFALALRNARLRITPGPTDARAAPCPWSCLHALRRMFSFDPAWCKNHDALSEPAPAGRVFSRRRSISIHHNIDGLPTLARTLSKGAACPALRACGSSALRPRGQGISISARRFGKSVGASGLFGGVRCQVAGHKCRLAIAIQPALRQAFDLFGLGVMIVHLPVARLAGLLLRSSNVLNHAIARPKNTTLAVLRRPPGSGPEIKRATAFGEAQPASPQRFLVGIVLQSFTTSTASVPPLPRENPRLTTSAR